MTGRVWARRLVSGAAVLGLALMACGRPGAPARPPDAGGRGPAARGGFDSGAAAPVESGAGGLGEEAASGAIVRAPATDGDVLLTDVAEVRGKLRAGAPMLLIDARGRADYELEHIPGAVNVPLPKIAATGKLPGVPHDYEIVVYCSAEACPLSREAARALASFGYTNVKDMRAGLVGWKQAGFETTKGSG